MPHFDIGKIKEELKEKMNAKKVSRIILIVVFFLFLIVPSLLRNRIEGKESKYEKRYLAKYPSLVKNDGEFNDKYFKEFDDWASDNLWNRDTMIHNYNQFMYDTFSTVNKKSNFTIGQNREIFYTSENSIKNYTGIEYVDKENVEAGKEFLLAFDDLCKISNRSFYYMPLVDKEEVKAEYFPKSINKINEKNDIDRFVDKIKNETDVKVYYPKELLQKEKDKYTIFSRTGDVTHWTDRGAYMTYLDFMKTISENEKYDFKILGEEDFNIQKVWMSPDLYGGVSDPAEIEIFRLKEKNTEEFYYIVDESEENNTFDKVRYRNDKLKKGKNLLIIGDSYIDYYWMFYIQESFYNTVFLHFLKIEYLPYVLSLYNPDIIIFENASREFFLRIDNFKVYADYIKGVRDIIKRG